jgi:hypothetical protein
MAARRLVHCVWPTTPIPPPRDSPACSLHLPAVRRRRGCSCYCCRHRCRSCCCCFAFTALAWQGGLYRRVELLRSRVACSPAGAAHLSAPATTPCGGRARQRANTKGFSISQWPDNHELYSTETLAGVRGCSSRSGCGADSIRSPLLLSLVHNLKQQQRPKRRRRKVSSPSAVLVVSPLRLLA